MPSHHDLADSPPRRLPASPAPSEIELLEARGRTNESFMTFDFLVM